MATDTEKDSAITELESLKRDIDSLATAIKEGDYLALDLDSIISDVHRMQATLGGWAEI